jgi:beta-lactamase regulating signal transducer with metallopeptidase domain
MDMLVHAVLANAIVVSILALFVGGLACAMRGRHPAVVHGLWLIVMIKLVTPPVFPVELSLPRLASKTPVVHTASAREPLDIEDAEDSPAVETALDRAALVPSEVGDKQSADKTELPSVDSPGWSWESVLISLLVGGAAAWWTLAAVRIVRFQRLLGEVRPVPDKWAEPIDELARRMGLDCAPEVSLVPGRIPPMLWSIGARPRLLLPLELWSSMSEDERSTLVLHELAHLKRGDHWVRWLELLVAGLYWWHPVVWYIRSALREAEEHCCDAWVVWAMPRGSKTYATALVAALDFVSGACPAPAVASATSGNGHLSCLKRRLRMIVRAKTPKGLSWAGSFIVLGLAALILPLAPSWANDDASAAAQDSRIENVGDREMPERSDGDDDDDDDDDKPGLKEKEELVDGLEERLKELIGKLTKELTPAAQELGKAVEKAVGEVQKTLEKDNLTGEEIAKTIDRSLLEVRKAFETDGPVNKELRDAIERSRDEIREAMEEARDEIAKAAKSQAESLRKEAEALADREASKLDELKSRMENDQAGRGDGEQDRQEVESARREIRELEQQMRRATRRLEELQQRREGRRGGGARRPTPPARPEPPKADSPDAPKPPATPAPPDAPKPAAPAPPAPPATPTPAGRPFGVRSRRPVPPPAGRRAAPRENNDERIHQLEKKMNELLEELKNLKAKPKTEESKTESGTERTVNS